MNRGRPRRKIAVITSSRSDYAHLRWLLHDLGNHPSVDLRIIAIGPHLSPEFGHTSNQIFPPAGPITFVECLISSDTDIGMAKSLGVATLGLADVLGRSRPDLIVLIADRYEMLAPASVALTLRIPIAHIEGGEITSGAIDDAVRNAITKMAHLHFACTRNAQRRLIGMGEEKSKVFWSGSLSLDDIRRSKLLSKRQLRQKLGVPFDSPTILAVYHPVTLLQDTVAEAEQIFAALGKLNAQILFVYPNADAGCRKIIDLSRRFECDHRNSKVFINLDHVTYLSLLRNVDLLIGNSSSGMIESTSLGLPALNIGIRQRGREHAANVLDAPANSSAILKAINRAIKPAFKEGIQKLKNPYGDGHASQRIVQVLTETPLGPELLFKT
jgi:UDP-hydrolysing UDP-N-acetyl-D-glucosamine 2-epimerase